MIVVRLMGGLGNQMFQYAAGLSLSLRYHVPLRLDTAWFDSVADGKHDTPRQYELDVFGIEGLTLPEWRRRWMEKLHTHRWRHARRLLHLLGSSLVPAELRDREAGYDERVFTAGSKLLLEGYWQNEEYFQNIRPELLKKFTFAQPPDRENEEMLGRIDADNAVCLHIRRGDYLAEKGIAMHGVCDPAYYRHAIELLQKQLHAPTFYIFSDDPAWVFSSFPKPENSVVVTHNTGRKNAEDLRLMMRCRHFLIANSSFSWWAAWLGDFSAKMVVAPSKWYANREMSRCSPVPKRWITI